jgi:GntR family transcriptional regulator
MIDASVQGAPKAAPSLAAAPMSGPSPLFMQVRDALRGEILEGTLRAGQRLPSESELIARFGVSRITVRQALADLQATGLVKTVNGKGSYVTLPGRGQGDGPLVGILEAMRKRGYRAHGRMLSHKTGRATRVVARELGLPVGASVGAVTVLRFRDEVPFVIGTTWSSPGLAERLAAQDLSETDVATAIEALLGLRSAAMRVIVGARLADARLARRLDYPIGSPVLHIQTTSVGYDGLSIAYSETDCRADMMDYRVTLRSRASAPVDADTP